MAVFYKVPPEEVPPNFEIQCKKDINFSFDFGWYSIHLDIARKKKWGRGEGACLTDKIR